MACIFSENLNLLRIDADSLTISFGSEKQISFLINGRDENLKYKIEMGSINKLCSFSRRSYCIIDCNSLSHFKCCGMQLTLNKRAGLDLERVILQFIRTRSFDKLLESCIPCRTSVDNDNVLIKTVPYGRRKF